jgi:F-type H+-transporting ATPase subunit delta
MTDMNHIARPYARAIFELAKEKDTIEDWSSVLDQLATYASDQAVAEIMADPQVSGAEIVNVFQTLLGELANDYTHNFLLCLAEHSRFVAIQDIAEIYEALKSALENKVDVTLTSAFEVSDEFLETIKSKLKKRFNSDIDIKCQIDESIIGGAIIVAGDLVIDGSVQGKMQRLSNSLLA